jgi:predicted nucleic acid-binding protein
MTNKIFVDTNIIIDLLSKREFFYEESQELFSLADKNKLELYISALTFANAYCILGQNLKIENSRKILRKFKVLVKVLPLNDKIIDLALDSDFDDFDDAIQYFTAIENDCEIIVTRNLKDFKNSNLPVFTARQFLELIN